MIRDPSARLAAKRQAKPVSMRDVACRAGVSPTAVSFYINGRDGISEATRERIRKAVEATQYKPDVRLQRFFKTMHGGCRATAFLTTPHHREFAENPGGLYSRVFSAVQKAVRAAGHHLVVVDAQHDILSDGNLRCVAENLVGGVITDTGANAVLEPLSAYAPIVTLNEESLLSNVDAVLPDVKRAVREQMDYLLGLGHRRIACFRPRPADSWQNRDLWNGYEEHAARKGVPLPPAYLAPIAFKSLEHARAIGEFLERVLRPGMAPTAILTYDLYAGELIRQMRERGLEVPGDISLVGFDDDAFTEACPLPLTTFRQDFEAMAETAVALLRERMKDPQRPARVVEIAGKMIERMSTAPVRALSLE